jgi:hypothetical protein
VSIGVHRVPSSTRKVTDLVRATQAALKVSKTGGKDRVSVSPDSGVPAVQSLEYKEPRPLVRLSDREVIGWDPGTTEPVDPSQKLRRTLRRAAMPEYDLVRIERLAAAAPLDAGRVLLPVLPSTLVRLPVSELIAQLPDRVAPENVTLVLDEECLFGAPSGLVPPVAALRERGVSVMMHVRGFGVTCLESLVLLRPSWVRIDAERVRGAANRVAVRAVLARFIAVCDALDIEVVVAGIATEKDLQALSGLGVDYGQGPLLG